MTNKELGELDYDEFVFRSKMLAEEKSEKLRQQMIAASFTAWQLKDTKKTFDEYLRALGLADKQGKMSDELRRKMVERNIGIAERIRKASRKQRVKK